MLHVLHFVESFVHLQDTKDKFLLNIWKSGMLRKLEPGKTSPNQINKWGLETLLQLYQMSFSKECISVEGVHFSALNSIIDNTIMLRNVHLLWRRFGMVTTKPWNSTPSLQLGYAEPVASIYPDLFSVIYLSGEQQEILFLRPEAPRKTERTVASSWTVEVWESQRHWSHRICWNLEGLVFYYSQQGKPLFAV